MSESLKVILKNIYTFLDVLQMTLSDQVQHWDTNMVDKALRWAKYCTQLYEQADGKPYRDDLDQKIQELGQLPWLLGDITINLDLLNTAESLTKQALIQNPHLSNELLDYTMSLYNLQTVEGRKTFIQVCRELNRDRSCVGLLTVLSQTLTTTCKLQIESQADILTHFLYKLLNKAPPHKTDRTRSFLKKKLSEFAVKPGALVLLTTILRSRKLHIEDVDNNIVNNMKTIILHTILDLPEQYKLEFKTLLTQDSEPVTAHVVT